MRILLLILISFSLRAQVQVPVIILDKVNRHWLDSVRTLDSLILTNKNHVWFEYVQARNGEWFLPFAVWNDPNFSCTKNRILAAGFQDSLNVQMVDTSFFIKPKHP